MWRGVFVRFSAQIRGFAAVVGWLGAPLLVLLVLAATVRNGRPFERHHIALDTSALSNAEQSQLRIQFRHTPEVSFEPARSRARAESMLRIGMVCAALSRESGRPALRAVVGGHDVLFGWGLVSVLPQPAELALVQSPRFGYLHFLLPGVLTFVMLGSSLFGMGRVVRSLRAGVAAAGLGTGWRALLPPLAARTLAQGSIGLAQIGVLVICARLFFGLPLGSRAAASLALVSAIGLLSFSGVSVALAACVDVDSALLKLAQLVQLPLLVLSEAILLLDELPRPLRLVGERLPTTYLVRVLREIVLDGGEIELARYSFGLSLLGALGVVGFVGGSVLLKWRTDPGPRQLRRALSAK